MSNRVQQVLKDARAMISTQRPETPIIFTPPIRSLSRNHRNLASIRHVPFAAGSLPSRTASINSNITPRMKASSLSTSNNNNSISLAPEIKILVQSDRECTEVVKMDSHFGKLWRESLLNSDNKNVSCRSAAIILRHCEDELVDETLAYLTNQLQHAETPTDIIAIMKAEGTLDSFIIAVRSSHFQSPSNIARLQKSAELLELLTYNEQIHKFLVTHGIFQSICEGLSFILKEYNTFGKISSGGGSENIIKCQSAADSLLLSLRNLCESSFLHHVLKVGLVNVLVLALNSSFTIAVRVLCKLSFNDDCLANFIQNEEMADSLVRALIETPESDYITQARIYITLSRMTDGDMAFTRDLYMSYWGGILPHFMTILSDLSNECIVSSPSIAPESYNSSIEARNEMWCSALSLMSALTLYPEAGEALLQSNKAMCILQNFVDHVSSFCEQNHSKSPEVLEVSALRLGLMCLSNASYYLSVIEAKYQPQEFKDIISHLSICVSSFLFEGDSEASVEATRTLGNISSVRAGKEWILENECDDVCALFLCNTDHRLVYNCIGILINVISDESLFYQFQRPKTETVTLILQYTQLLLRAPTTPWEIKDLVEILLKNTQSLIALQEKTQPYPTVSGHVPYNRD